MKNFLNKILKALSSIVFAILVIIVLLIIFYIARINYLAKNDRLGDIRINFYTILTQSMYPTIKAGDVVITYKNDDNVYKKGDIITFVSNLNGGINITHRVEKVYKNEQEPSYKTKGDNNNAADTEITKGSNVLGKVVVTLPKVGYIQQFLVTKTGWIIAVILPALGVIIYDILKIFKAAFRRKNKLEENEEIKEAKEKLNEVLTNEKVNPQIDNIVSDNQTKDNEVLEDEEEIELL